MMGKVWIKKRKTESVKERIEGKRDRRKREGRIGGRIKRRR